MAETAEQLDVEAQRRKVGSRSRADRGPRRAKEPPSDVRKAEETDELRSRIGGRIRELRQERHIGLRVLATKSGVTSGFLSQIEGGHVMPSIASLVSICAVLQVHVGDVFDAEGSKARLIHPCDRIVYAFPTLGIRDEVLTADPTYRIEVVHTYFDPKADTGREPYSHGTEVEAGIVLRGRLILRLDSEEILLKAGDAITYPGTVVHDMRNPGDRPAEAIWVYSPATY
jgi:transcriptional regulator with XRE-family HTH domain